MTTAAGPLYYLQTRGHCGNCYLWWRKGKHGYTTEIREAHEFTKEEAFAQARMRPDTDFPWPKAYIDARVSHHINAELVSRQCVWRGTAARGVYLPDCQTEGVLGVPPALGSECPYCARPAVQPPRPRVLKRPRA